VDACTVTEGPLDAFTVTDRNNDCTGTAMNAVKIVNGVSGLNGTNSGMPPPVFTSPAKVCIHHYLRVGFEFRQL
jgi:hypothetical protein